MRKIALAVLVILGAFGAYFILQNNREPQEIAMPKEEQPQEEAPLVQEELGLRSSAFEHMGGIPTRYTCDGEKLSPPLAISGVSKEAKSLVLIMEDPDVPRSARSDGMWDHWLKFNLPPTIENIGEGEDPGGVSGITTSKNLKYVPPCPPDREHRYFFKLFSLDTMLDLKEGAAKSEIQAAMQGHILQEATLVGLYERK